MQGPWFILHKDHHPGSTSQRRIALPVQKPFVPDQGPAAVKNERSHLEQHPAAETPARPAAGKRQHTESPREVPSTP